MYQTIQLIRCRTLLLLGIWLTGCTGLPIGITPVEPFQLERYLGTWYEIARLDHSFERGLSQVSANYSLQKDGTVTVINRGYDAAKQQWQQAEGRAKLVSSANVDHLKVSFFGPFFGGYAIFYLDEEYQNAYVTSYNRDYLWYLSRSATVTDAQWQHFITTITNAGFNTAAVIRVKQ